MISIFPQNLPCIQYTDAQQPLPTSGKVLDLAWPMCHIVHQLPALRGRADVLGLKFSFTICVHVARNPHQVHGNKKKSQKITEFSLGSGLQIWSSVVFGFHGYSQNVGKCPVQSIDACIQCPLSIFSYLINNSISFS